ncbi:MAG: hypothetical protein ABEJ68_09965 [Halobacteriaceae archaeon]
MGRHALGLALLSLALLSAGCAGVSSGGDAGPATPTGTAEMTVPPEACPDPPANLSESAVESAAIAHAKARLHNRLRNDSDVTYFSIGYTMPPSATVLNRSDGGASVAVEVHYAYGTGDVDADGVPVRALYVVSETEIRRVGELDTYPPRTTAGEGR